MNKIEMIFEDLRKKGLRITSQRKEIISILNGKHLSFNQIRDELKKRGHTNLATLYNNIEFLLEHEIIIELYINGTKFYDLSIEEASHDASTHLHVKCEESDLIVEVNDGRIFDLIRQDPIFENFNSEKIEIVVRGTCKYKKTENCNTDHSLCFLKELEDQYK